MANAFALGTESPRASPGVGSVMVNVIGGIWNGVGGTEVGCETETQGVEGSSGEDGTGAAEGGTGEGIGAGGRGGASDAAAAAMGPESDVGAASSEPVKAPGVLGVANTEGAGTEFEGTADGESFALNAARSGVRIRWDPRSSWGGGDLDASANSLRTKYWLSEVWGLGAYLIVPYMLPFSQFVRLECDFESLPKVTESPTYVLKHLAGLTLDSPATG